MRAAIPAYQTSDESLNRVLEAMKLNLDGITGQTSNSDKLVALGKEATPLQLVNLVNLLAKRIGLDGVTAIQELTNFMSVASAGADIASAVTLPLTARTGNIVRITGTTATSAVTLSNGDYVVCIPTGLWPLTYNATTNPVQGGVSYTCSVGDLVVYWKDNSGVLHNQIIKVDGTSVATIQNRGFIDGLIMSTSGSSATLSVAAGAATDSTNTARLSLATSISKTTGAWAVGTANGGLDTGVIANSTWYYWYLIRRPDTGVVDVVFSTSASSPTLPTNYTQYRRIGAGLTNGSAQWVKFFQNGNEFLWDTPVLDVSVSSAGTAAVFRTLSVPRIAGVKALMNIRVVAGPSGELIYVSDGNISDLAPSFTTAPLGSIQCPASLQAASQISCSVNASAQIRTRCASGSASEAMYFATYGWVDGRGRDA